MRLVGVGALLAVAVLGGLILSPGAVNDLDFRIFDAISQRAGAGQASGNVVIVGIDEASLAQAGRWPWPREVVATLIRRIIHGGASTVVLDMMFPESDAGGPAIAAPRTAGSRATPVSTTGDQSLAQAVSEGRVVIGYLFNLGGSSTGSSDCAIVPASLVMEENASPSIPDLFHATSVLCSAPPIAQAAALAGFLNGAPDGDGRLRRLPLLIEYQEHVYPSLALAAFVANAHSRWLKIAADGSGTATLRIDIAEVPLGHRGDLLLRFRGKAGALAHVSASDVLSGRVPADALRNKIAVVGGLAAGLEPSVATPVDPFFPGVELQATALDNLLRQDFFSRPGWTRFLELALGLLSGFAAAIVLFFVRPLWGLGALLGLCVCVWLAAIWVMHSAGVFFSPLPVLATVAVEFALLTPVRLTIERKEAAGLGRQLLTARKFMLSVLQSLTANQGAEMASHVARMQRYMRPLCEAAARKPTFRKLLNKETIELLVQLAPIHDLGKIGVPDRILSKPGALDFEEWETMKSHVVFGYEVLEKACIEAGANGDAIYRLARDIVHSHHERWDGKGYPEGLAREAIPFAGRLLAVADVYDALVSSRSYKPAISHAEVVQKIVAASGSQFDPTVVEAFLEVKETWRQIAEELPAAR